MAQNECNYQTMLEIRSHHKYKASIGQSTITVIIVINDKKS